MARASSWCGVAMVILSCGGSLPPPPEEPPPESQPAVAQRLAGATGARPTGDEAAAPAPGPVPALSEAPPAGESAEVAAPLAGEPGCTVRGVASLGPLRIEVEGDRPVELSVTSRDVSARLLPRARVAPVRLLAPVTLEASVAPPLPVVFARDADLSGGVVHVSRGTRIERVVMADDGALAVDAELAPGVGVRGLAVPCELLGLGAVPVVEASEPDETEGLLSRGGRLQLFSAPGAESSVTVRLSRPHETLLTETARRDGWVRLWHSFPSGAGFSGWARESAVRPGRAAPPRPPRAPRPVTERRVRECHTAQPGFYRGPATVASGTAVLGAPGGAAWGRVAAPLQATVRTVVDADWVVIDSIAALSGSGPCPEILDRAWVPRSAVTFPAHLAVPGSVPESAPPAP